MKQYTDKEIRALCKMMEIIIEPRENSGGINLFHSSSGVNREVASGIVTTGDTLQKAWLRYLWKIGDPNGEE